MSGVQGSRRAAHVAPHAGAWIEITNIYSPSETYAVAPHAGAWIEICVPTFIVHFIRVAPHAGAWIEMIGVYLMTTSKKSRPTRARGLK